MVLALVTPVLLDRSKFIDSISFFLKYRPHLDWNKISSETISIWGVPENLRYSLKNSKAFLWEGAMKHKNGLFRKVHSWKHAIFCFWFDMGGARIDEDKDMLMYTHTEFAR